ncbi:hypothetical protein O6H91_10G078100 [Diphasiastrum complanatum]|uniref:Uncharacterized protein n=1 Tax=Diphasiastrum complanatum TaxID=34168 RepID=A0ACC2CIK5_DIPCM|nr:hypothetical protein O6H91_10G078100 [Diphasiastrum complanatum]
MPALNSEAMVDDDDIMMRLDAEAAEYEADNALARETHQYYLQEWQQLQQLLACIVTSQGAAELSTSKNAQSIIAKYQEQSHLLEPHLEDIILPLTSILETATAKVRDASDLDMDFVKRICMIIHTLVTVCGYKTVVKFLPHQAHNLEITVAILERCHQEFKVSSISKEERTGEWETECTLLLWLSILVLIPFDMTSVDTSLSESSFSEKHEPVSPLVERIIQICKDYLSSPGPVREMAGVLLSRLLTRPDMSDNLLSFVNWTQLMLASTQDTPTGVFLVPGVLGTLAAIFKVGGRDILISIASLAWQDASDLACSQIAGRSPLLRKLLMKLILRIGLTYLSPRVAVWRYMQGTQSLARNLGNTSVAGDHSFPYAEELQSDANMRLMCQEENGALENEAVVLSMSNEQEFDIPEVVEDIIGRLLDGLKDKDTVVRWSAAKGIGQLTNRLTSGNADDVVASVMDLFSVCQGDGAWHGGCLALAELARRGLLLPKRLIEVVPVIIQALHYDVRRGPHSVGAHVRDAAAYVCWAFARAYSPLLMRDHFKQLAPSLLAISCYDREVNCRRAASAAFQENVGRQGDFLHGIEIVNTVNYFALGSRSYSYKIVAVYVAQFDEYRGSLIEELLQSKIGHWDRGIRELAAEALSCLAKYESALFEDTILQTLISRSLSSDLNLRHGACLAAAEVVKALHECGFRFSSEKEKAIANMVPAIEKARLYRGKGGEIMRGAVCRLIESIGIAKIPLSQKFQKTIMDTLDENLKHPNSQIQVSAVAGFQAFVKFYLLPATATTIRNVVTKHVEALNKDPNPAKRRGAALALGALPPEYLLDSWREVINALCFASSLEENVDDRDAETRVNAVRSLKSVCKTLVDASGLATSVAISKTFLAVLKGQVMDCFFSALDDYAIDNRGDVGSWVREAAMEGIECCAHLLCQCVSTSKDLEQIRSETIQVAIDAKINTEIESDMFYKHTHCDNACVLDERFGIKIIGGLAKQAVEKIDHVRDIAGRTLQRLIHSLPVDISFIPHRIELERLMPKDTSIHWADPGESFPQFVQILQFPEYRPFLVSGIVISIGGLAELLGNAALKSLLNSLKLKSSEVRMDDSAVEISSNWYDPYRVGWLGEELVHLLKVYAGNDRVIVPAIKDAVTQKTLHSLLSRGVFSESQESAVSFELEVIKLLQTEVRGCRDVGKLIAIVNVLSGIASMRKAASNEALLLLLALLSHRYPKVRKITAEQLYLLLIQRGEELMSGGSINTALDLISETCWDGPLEGSAEVKATLTSFAVGQKRMQCSENMGSQAPRQEYKKSSAPSDENESYASLVDAAGY